MNNHEEMQTKDLDWEKKKKRLIHKMILLEKENQTMELSQQKMAEKLTKLILDDMKGDA